MRPLTSLPKAELHIHLEGGVRTPTLRELAARDGLPLPPALGDDDRWRFTGPADFIESFMLLCSLFTRLDDLRRVAVEFCEDLATTGVRYAEAVFSPGNHARRFGDWFSPIEAVLDGLEAGRRAYGVTVRLCPDIVRDMGVDDAERTLEVALRYAGAGVVALNAAGSEQTGIEPFDDFFHRARAAGLGVVPHAGEWAGAENVWATISHYRPDRIGHGVRAIEDASLVAELARTRIPLEICPLSNVATGVYPDLTAHPFRALRDAGVVVTLNSDDPAMFGAWLHDVYAAAQQAWALTDEDLADLAKTAIRVSFADESFKASLARDIDGWLVADAEAPAMP